MGVGVRLLCISYARINSVASIPPITGIETSIYAVSGRMVYFRRSRAKACHTHKYDAKRPILLHARLERVYRERPILYSFNCVAILLEDFDGQLLVHEVVLGD
jgi:hypothetical protein